MDADADLVARAVAGDAAAFELLVRRHQEAAWRMAVSILASPHDAEEALQETFLRAYRGLASFRRDAAFRTWLLAIGRRACSDLLARREKVVPLEVHRVGTFEGTPEDRVVIEATMAAMPVEERTAFTLVDLLGLTREEAARVEAVPPSTLKSRLYRARDRLASALLAEEPGERRGDRG